VRTVVGVATEKLGLLVHHHVKSDAIAIPQAVHFENDVLFASCFFARWDFRGVESRGEGGVR
jgi:hypothetical protein